MLDRVARIAAEVGDHECADAGDRASHERCLDRSRDGERRGSVREKLRAGRVALVGLLRERLLQDCVDRRRQGRSHSGEERRRLVDVGEDDLEVALARERRRAGQALEENAAERVDVGARVDLAGRDLLRGDVRDGSDEPLRAREALGAGRVAGKSEVTHVRLFAVGGDEHVRRLDVTVDEAERMRGVERVRHRPEQADRKRRIKTAGCRVDELAKVVALDIPHRQIEQPAFSPGGVDRDDVRVVEARRELRLDEKPLAEALVLRELGREDLDGDLAPEVHVLAQIDSPHRTPPHQALDPEAGKDTTDLYFERHG